MLEHIINQLENFDIEQQEYQQAVDAWLAADAHYMEVVAKQESWTPAQLESIRELSGINRAKAALAATARRKKRR